MTGFVFLWGWLSLGARSLAGEWAVLPPVSRPAGTVLIVAGGVLALWCIGLFVVQGDGTPAPFDPPRSFVPNGPYRVVRNPMYVGGLLVLAGFGLWHTSLTMTAVAWFVALVVHLFVVLYEEPSLERRFGSSYVAYKQAVRRWLPRVP